MGRKARHIYSHNGSINPVAVARDLGFEVRESQLPKEVVGSVYRNTQFGRVILLASNLKEGEKRFACSQLIGHYLHMRRGGVDEWLQHRDPESVQRESYSQEIFAIEFARNLLVPKIYHQITRYSETVRDFVANRYSVPREVLAA